MNATVGEYSLAAAMLVSAITVVAAIGAARFGTDGYHRAARWGFGLFAALLGIASAALTAALVQSDFSIAYIASYTERALPVGYKLSAFWAGQEGSLLFWGMVLAAMALVFVITRRRDQSRQHALSLLTLTIICGFFAAMILFAANPFRLGIAVPADGHGLNPMLQNIGMIAHPPTLFAGYAGFTIPFALMMGALLAGNVDSTWITVARRWVLVSWLFLTVGIVLGAQWAYVELGWGGYWAWDPVENASLLPWLTGTALLHSIVMQQHRSMYKTWNLALAAVTFLLCIFGTYLTRSGVIQSVHAFEKSLIGTFFLAFLITTTLASIVMIAVRFRKLRGQPQLEGFISREGAVLIGNAMFVLMMALTLLGTIFPLISEALAGRPITVNQSFYNKSVLPLAILMLLMMGVAPLLAYGPAQLTSLARRLRIPLVISLIATVVTLLIAGFSLWTAFCALAIAMTVCAVIADFIAVVIARNHAGGGGIIACIFCAIDANHRRYGGHLAHLGIAMIVAGVAGSSLYSVKTSLQLEPGQSGTVGQYALKLDTLESVQAVNYEAAEALVSVTNRRGETTILRPQIRHYNKAEQNSAEVAFQTGLREDLYVTLVGVEKESAAALQVVVNPLVLWIWIGGIALALGGIWCMLPQMIPSRRVLVNEVIARPAANEAVSCRNS